MQVNGYGPKDAKIILLGEAPGAEEDRSGIPFSGSSGKLLNQMLASAGIERELCYVTNVVKIQPPRNDFDIFYLDKKRRQPSPILQQSIRELHTEIAEIHPNVIVAMGNEALRAITGRVGISSWRGSILSSPLGKCIPTLHPAYVLRMYQSRPIVELDLKRVLEESTSPEVKIPTQRFDINPSFERVCQYLSQPFKRVAFDIETTSCGPGRVLTRCLGLSGELNHAICIPFISSVSNPMQVGQKVLFEPTNTGSSLCSTWNSVEEYEILRLLDKLFRDPSIEKIAQNMGFDVPILAREFGFSFANVHMDTMLAHHTCYCELPKGLDFLTSIYTRTPYYSDYDSSVDRETWVYNCYDASVTYEISQRLDGELREMGVADYYYSIKHPAALALLRAETRGILIDNVERAKRTIAARTERDRLEQEIRKVVNNPDFNCRSDKQIKDYLYGTLKLKPVFKTDPKTREKRITSDKHARDALRLSYPEHCGILNLFSDHSTIDTLLSNFLEKPLGSDGRVRTHYNAAGTDTDRLSSSEPMFDVGTNLQNIPKGDFRRMFIADDGWQLLKADLSQAEFRIVCWLGKIFRIIDRYATDPDFDVHTWVASLIFNKPENLIERKRSDGKLSERDIAKNGVYGGNYDMQFKKAALVYKMPVEQAKFVLEKYRNSAVPEVPQWWLSVQAVINSTRRTTNPLGRTRLWFDRLDQDLYRTAYSDSAQSIVSGVINRAFALLDEILDETFSFPLLQVHDEIVTPCRTEHVQEVALKIKNVMKYPLYFPDVPVPLIIPADISFGPNWFDQKKVSF